MYQPQPIDTSAVSLSIDIRELTEYLAAHAHEIWSQQRIKDGWTLGPTRDDVLKQHPCLIPYDQLPDSERQYDRNAALETLKVIVARGYDIVPPMKTLESIPPVSDAAVVRQRYEELIEQIRAAETSDQELTLLLQIWNTHSESESVWCYSPELYQRLARRFLKRGAAPQAKEVARAALEWNIAGPDVPKVCLWQRDVSLRQLFGLALARTGNTDDAQKVLLQLHQDGQTDEETLGILGRTYKDQAFQTSDELARRTKLLESLKHYRKAYTHPNRFWIGINVATLHLLLGDLDESSAVARELQQVCARELAEALSAGQSGEAIYWNLATQGEAALILGDFETAGRQYQAAQVAAPRSYGDLNSTRRHARWLLAYWIKAGRLQEGDATLLDSWLPLPTVVVFVGHMLDRPQRGTERFPARLVESVKRTIKDWVSDNNALIGYSSAACGADLLFLQAIQELGGESHIVLPFDAAEFKITSVSLAGDDWTKLFDEVLERATEVITASPQKFSSGSISYEYANLVLHGLSTVKAAELQTRQMGLVVWDRRTGDGPGGTASVVQCWRALDLTVDCVDLSQLPSAADVGLPIVRNPEVPERVYVGSSEEVTSTRIMALLFGDAVNFSKLSEVQVPRFVQHFLGPIGDIIRRYSDSNVVRNTWGDGLYLVFSSVRDAGLCALEICDFVKTQVDEKRWSLVGLPEDLNVRLALHAGPVFGCRDPITGHENFTGTHVSRAARLEPKTPPGEVYASEGLAALCAQSKVSEFACDFVKQLAWAKHYGTFPTYVLRRKSAEEVRVETSDRSHSRRR